MELNFEQVTEVYAGLPLKQNFMEAGIQALKTSGAPDFCMPEIMDNRITMQVINRPFFKTEEEFIEYCKSWAFDGMTLEEVIRDSNLEKGAVCEAEAYIDLEEGEDGFVIKEIDGDSWITDADGDDAEYLDYKWDWYWDEWNRFIVWVEAFLNAAVDLEKM